MRKVFVGIAAVALLAVPACGGDDDGSAAPDGATTKAATETTTARPSTPETPAPTGAVPPAWPTAPVTAPFTGSVPPVPRLVAIRVGGHPEGGYDRLALEFDGLPGYSVKYRTQVLYDGSGEPVRLPGHAYLQIVANPAQAHDDDGHSTLAHPPTVPVNVGLPALTSYVLNGDFEAYVSVALGLAEKAGFQVKHYRAATGHYVIYVDVARPVG